jgi:glycosyltransferase involved in cell wall biosynthesis
MPCFFISEDVSEYLKKSKPSIAILAPSLDTIPSKQGNAIYCLIEDIAFYSSNQVLVFSKYENGLPQSKINDRIVYYKKPLKKTLFQKLIGHRGRKIFFGISWTEDITYTKQVYRFCMKNGIRCLVVEDANSLLAGLPAKPALNIILHQHANSLVNLIPRFFYSFTHRLSHIVFVSETNRSKTCRKFANLKTPTSTIYNGIDPAVFKTYSGAEKTALKTKLDISGSTITLLFAGRIDPHKGIKELLLSLTFLGENDIHILIAGDLKTLYNYDPEFEKSIRELVTEKTTLLGQLSQAEIYDYYAISDFVIVPSTGAEGLPKVITEALVMGKPVIASDRGGIIELVKDGVNGVIIEEPVSPENIAKAIIKAVSNKGSLTKNAEENMDLNRERFSSEAMAKQFDALFSRFI